MSRARRHGARPETSFGTISAITLLLFVGAAGKSAQIPLYVWLPDAMEGPTPVSALIHAATMVTAGVYMIARNAVLFSHAPPTLSIVAIVGVATALMAGTIGLVQNDIKRVLAYSTVSQLGYMFLAMGVGAYAAGIFHLFTHAFFKALLFLGSGAVIHALSGEQDLRNMGGLKKDLPLTYWTFVVGALAISGFPFLSGFFSKDEILYPRLRGRAYGAVGGRTPDVPADRGLHVPARLPGVSRRAAAAMTAARQRSHLSRRMQSRGTHARPRRSAGDGARAHRARDWLGGGGLLPCRFGGANWFERFLEPSFGAAWSAHIAAMRSASDEQRDRSDGRCRARLVALAGIGVAAFYFLKRRARRDRLASRFSGLYRVLINKYYVDEIYDAALVQPIRIISEDGLWRGLDVRVIDGAVNGVAEVVGAAQRLRRLQTGSVRAYAASLFLGVVTVLGYYLWR